MPRDIHELARRTLREVPTRRAISTRFCLSLEYPGVFSIHMCTHPVSRGFLVTLCSGRRISNIGRPRDLYLQDSVHHLLFALVGLRKEWKMVCLPHHLSLRMTPPPLLRLIYLPAKWSVNQSRIQPSAGFLVSGWSPGETRGWWKKINFCDWLFTVSFTVTKLRTC